MFLFEVAFGSLREIREYLNCCLVMLLRLKIISIAGVAGATEPSIVTTSSHVLLLPESTTNSKVGHGSSLHHEERQTRAEAGPIGKW